MSLPMGKRSVSDAGEMWLVPLTPETALTVRKSAKTATCKPLDGNEIALNHTCEIITTLEAELKQLKDVNRHNSAQIDVLSNRVNTSSTQSTQLKAQNQELAGALERCRGVVSGYERQSENHIKWIDTALAKHRGEAGE